MSYVNTENAPGTPYDGYHLSSENSSGKMGAWRVKSKVPSSHGSGDAIKIALVVAVSIFLGSIVFWAIGASTNVAGLEIVGKIFFGLSIAAIGIALIAACVVGGIFAKMATN